MIERSEGREERDILLKQKLQRLSITRTILNSVHSEEAPKTSEATWRCKISKILGIYKMRKITIIIPRLCPFLCLFPLPHDFAVFTRPWGE